MFDYIEPYITADKILHLLNTVRSRMQDSEINQLLKTDPNYVPNNVRSAIHQMEADKLIKFDGSLSDWIMQLGEGAILYANGGYRDKFKNDRFANELKNKIDTSTVAASQSVVDTNKILTKSIKLGNWLYWVTLAVALASTMATIRSCQISDEQTKQSKLIEMKDQQLQSLQKTLLQKESVRVRDSLLIDSLNNAARLKGTISLK
jgi:hypothetical protein